MVASGTRTESMAAAGGLGGGGGAGPGSPRAAGPAFKSPPPRGARGGRGQAPPSHWMRRRTSAIREPRGSPRRRPPRTLRDPSGTPGTPGTPGPAHRARGAAARPLRAPARAKGAAPARFGGRGARGTRLPGNRSGLNEATRLEAARERAGDHSPTPEPFSRVEASGFANEVGANAWKRPWLRETSAGLRPFRMLRILLRKLPWREAGKQNTPSQV
ncbi:collagen alpha-1(I) chain-like isoform X2 [Canis lupus dingo]|uniref:collagen alpha-1(I) chain-like isoform X2 n=1 Tax=Canis lupus dingo TaxID=286419 RepID=UPI0020C2A0B8|nr:collagen alpha-1(I) chain-like isoform X2 [Canis lupus dingo]